MMEWADRLAGQPGAETLKERLDEGLRRIAARSPTRELRGWGVLPAWPQDAQIRPPEGAGTQDPAGTGPDDAAARASASVDGQEGGGGGT